jgi:nucleotide-binding universal stress UspA family protein
MKKVLIALDYNPTAQKVAEMGYALAKAMGAEVILLHVTEELTYYTSFEYGPIMGFTGYVNSDMLKIKEPEEVKQSSLEFLEQTKKHLDDNNIKTTVAEGNIPSTIIKVADEMFADIIVMGSHSRRWLEKILLGSVTEEVLRNCTIPLFIIPTKEIQVQS